MGKLDVIQIASPCTASWEAMRGDERVRHCLQCHLDVYDLSAMSREEAEQFVRDSDGHACVRVVQRADGTVVTQDCTPAREEPPRPCVPRTAAAEWPSPSQDLSMAAKAKPRPPTMKMGKMVMPPPEVEPDPIDERLTRGTVLAELVRAVRAGFDAEVAERYVRALDGLVSERPGAKPGMCPRGEKCPLWIVPEPDGGPVSDVDALDARLKIVEALRACVEAAFDGTRASALLRELKRHPFARTRGPCPHCKRSIRALGTDEW